MNELTIRDINSAIMFGNFSNDELSRIINAIKYAQAQLIKQKAREFLPGDTVQFRDSKRGVLRFGNIVRIKLKFALVDSNGIRWNVPLGLLETV